MKDCSASEDKMKRLVKTKLIILNLVFVNSYRYSIDSGIGYWSHTRSENSLIFVWV